MTVDPANRTMAVTRDMLSEVCGEVAAALKRVCGRGPVNASARWAGPDTLLVLLENGHTEQERTLRTHGHGREVLAGRRMLLEILDREFVQIVEAATGREVLTTLTATRLDPDLTAQTFLLKPTGDETPSSSAILRARGARELTREHRAESEALRAEAAQAARKASARPAPTTPDRTP